MIIDVLNTIKDNLLASNKWLSEGYAGVRQLDDGKVTIGDYRSKKYVGISDKKGNFFYIRFSDSEDIVYSEPESRFTCDNSTVHASVPLKIVVIAKSLDNYGVEELIRGQLSGMKIDNTERERGIGIEVVSSNLDPIEVYKRETLQEEEIQLRKDLMIIEIVFTVEMDITKDDCITLDNLC